MTATETFWFGNSKEPRMVEHRPADYLVKQVAEMHPKLLRGRDGKPIEWAAKVLSGEDPHPHSTWVYRKVPRARWIRVEAYRVPARSMK